jgi:hypothetical protein
MSGEYPRGTVELFEDFLVDNGSASSGLTETTAGSGSMDITNKHGGWWRFTTSTGDTDDASISGECAWEVDEGHPLILEARLKCDDVDDICIFVGFGDAVNDTVVVNNEDATVSATATDCVGFLLEGEQDLTWQSVAVDSDTATVVTALTNGDDAADDTVQTLRLELNPNDSGTAKYFIDGKLVKTQTSYFDSSIVYCPIIAVNGRTTAAHVDVDYLYVMAPRS